jgi:hypothetical protein
MLRLMPDLQCPSITNEAVYDPPDTEPTKDDGTTPHITGDMGG